MTQSRTVHTGLAVVTGTEDRQHGYVALTRGTDTNMAYVFTLPAKLADPAPGPRRIADMMDARKVRIGEHAAENALPWAVNALGPVPGHPLDRLEWQRRASSIGAYRELSGHDHPAEPIGPEPVAGDPGKRAAWHEAFAALGPVDGPDVRGLPDGTLLHLRDTYPAETAWAPKWAGDELRQVRLGAREARLAAIRADAEAKAAAGRGDEQAAGRQQILAANYRAMHDAYREREAVFATTMADRADVGYLPELARTGLHGLDGARYLRDVQHTDPTLCRLVAHHSCAIIEAEERGLADILQRELTPPTSAARRRAHLLRHDH